MAKPRDTAKPDPPVESDDDEEEEESGEEEEEGSESEDETPQKKPTSTPAPAPAPKKPEPQTPNTQPTPTTAAASSEEEEEESGSESESDSDRPLTARFKRPDSNVKAIAPKSKKPRPESNSSLPTSPTKPTSGAGAKRPASATAADGGKDAKKTKKQSETEPESSESKGKLFQRLWSEDDEIAILDGMLDYSAKKKADPVADLNDFHQFIKKNLHIDVSRTQLQDKIRRLKKKYENIAKKENKDNKEKTFSKPHEQKAYDLSKNIWGKEKNNDGDDDKVTTENGTVVRKSRSKTPKDLVDARKNVRFGYENFKIEEWIMKDGIEYIKDEKKRGELEEKWRAFRVKEIELLTWRTELMSEQAKLILDGLKQS